MKCKTQNLVRKLTWFKEHLSDDKTKNRFTNVEIRQLVEE